MIEGEAGEFLAASRKECVRVASSKKATPVKSIR
jgi:hypothetical protein